MSGAPPTWMPHATPLGMALAAAVLLGLRHATDPDHLTAVSALVLGERGGHRRAAVLGMAWGLGHGATLFLFGLPVILLRRALPDSLLRWAEAAIGLLIVGLAVRLLVRWRRGEFHSHDHRHGARSHAHPHVHELAPGGGHAAEHRHAHAESLGRSPLAAFGIGLLHGVGGSAAVGVLLVGTMSGPRSGVVALALFAAATALSMALVSGGFGWLLTRAPHRRVEALVPAAAAAGFLFGCWYAAAALGLLPRGAAARRAAPPQALYLQYETPPGDFAPLRLDRVPRGGGVRVGRRPAPSARDHPPDRCRIRR